MKEFWVNVYQNKNGLWYGTPRKSLYDAQVVASKYLIYRIHVKMK